MKQAVNSRLAVLGLLGAALLVVSPAHAQYTNNFQTNIIDGVTIDGGVYNIPSSPYFADVLLIQNAGVLNSSGFIGFDSSGSNSAVIVTDPGSQWFHANALYIGYQGADNSLVITNGGVVVNSGLGDIGVQPSGSNNSVTVTGTGSVWSNTDIFAYLYVGDNSAGNSLTIADGGAVFCTDGRIGWNVQGSKNNTVAVTGAGSVWSNRAVLYVGGVGLTNTLTIGTGGSVFATNVHVGDGQGGNKLKVAGGSLYIADSTGNRGDLSVGYFGSGNELTISNGGGVFNAFSYVGNLTSSGVNTVMLTDTGSVWASRNDLYVGYSGSSNTLTIGAGGSVLASNAYVGFASGSNKLNVAGGNLYATNALGNGLLEIRGGNLTVNDGTVTVDKLLLTNGTSSVIAFNGGTLHSKTTAITNGQQFVVGDGVSAATFHLMGGVHSFNSGLEIRANSSLTGCGTINGVVVVDPDATVLADCGGTLTFFLPGSVTNNGTMRAIDGSTLQFYAKLVNNGTIDIINGSASIHGTFINNGTVLDASSVVIGEIGVSGNDVIVQIQSVLGHSYQMQITPLLSPPAWANSGPAQAGTGGELTFTDAGGATNQPSRLYRIQVTAP